MSSTLKERFARLGRVRGVDRVTSGSPAVLVLERMHDEPRPIDAVMALARRGASLLKAKRIIEEVIDTRRQVGIALPMVEDRLALIKELNDARIMAQSIRDEVVDVKALRECLGRSQEQFSLIYNIPLDTLRKWERREREPDTAAMNYLRMIQRCLGSSVSLSGIYGDEFWKVSGVKRDVAFSERYQSFIDATPVGGHREAGVESKQD